MEPPLPYFQTQKVRDHACNLAYNIFDGVVVLILLFCYYEYVQKYGERNLKDKECWKYNIYILLIIAIYIELLQKPSSLRIMFT